MKKLSFVLLSCLFWLSATGQLTISITAVPGDTPADATLFAAGSFNGWAAGDQSYTFEEQDDDTYTIELDISPGTYEYKITRGSWETVEGTAAGTFLPNRTVTYSGGEQTEEITIAGWEDVSGNSTATDNVGIVSNDFYMPQLDRNRRIWIYLPPDYNDTNNYYPVLYMHDGQNVFDAFTSFSGEWEVDESLNDLFEEGDEGIIVVAIDNGGGQRIDEYLPWEISPYGGGEGDEYMEFIVATLKPHIDNTYRTRPEREFTGLMGSSLGGLITMYGAIKHQDVFSKAGVFSPSFWISSQNYTHVTNTGKMEEMKFYLLAGEQEDDGSVVEDVQEMHTTLLNAGFSDNEINVLTHEDGEHSEWYWEREFPDAYTWLFGNVGPISDTDQGDHHDDIQLSPNPADNILSVQSEVDIQDPQLQIYAIDGRLILPRTVFTGSEINVSYMKPGTYLFRIYDGEQLIASKQVVIQ